MTPLRFYRRVWLVDFEFTAPPGERPVPICCVARELLTGELRRTWLADGVPATVPYDTGPDNLFVAFYASAELGCHLGLGWPVPARILDLYAEFRCETSGLVLSVGPDKKRHSLLCALIHHGLDALDAVEKEAMRQVAMRGGPFTAAEQAALLDYCQSDVDTLARLLPAMLPNIDLPRAVLRGRYMAAAALMEWTGIPIDMVMLDRLRRHWPRIKGRLVAAVNADYDVFVPTGQRHLDPISAFGAAVMTEAQAGGLDPHQLADTALQLWKEERDREAPPNQEEVLRPRHDPGIIRQAAELVARAGPADYRPMTFSVARWGAYLIRKGIPWPRLPSGQLALDDDTFRDMARAYPEVAPIRELRHALSQLKLNELAVGTDGRNRVLLSTFASKTGRNQPSNTRFIFGPSVWLRFLIKPAPGRAVAYVDWSGQEWGIAAALSGDKAMQEDYRSGDPYLAFGRRIGAVPADATKHSHGQERERLKTCCGLGAMYGAGSAIVASRLGIPECLARDWLRAHRERYATYWRWSDRIQDEAMLTGRLRTVFGWTVHVERNANPRSLRNFPMQAHGAEMLRLACCLATERGIPVCAPVHDALLIEGAVDEIDREVFMTQEAMREASEVILPGFPLRTDAKIVRYPDRYRDKRGERMWETVSRLLDDLDGL